MESHCAESEMKQSDLNQCSRTLWDWMRTAASIKAGMTSVQDLKYLISLINTI